MKCLEQIVRLLCMIVVIRELHRHRRLVITDAAPAAATAVVRASNINTGLVGSFGRAASGETTLIAVCCLIADRP